MSSKPSVLFADPVTSSNGSVHAASRSACAEAARQDYNIYSIVIKSHNPGQI